MRVFLYKISLVLGLLYFMAPFLNRGAESLANRGVAESLGLIIVFTSLYGMRSHSRKAAYVFGVVGLASIVWAGIGPWLHHLPGTFDCLLFGVIFMVLSWLITRTLSIHDKDAEFTGDMQDIRLEQIGYKQGYMQLEGIYRDNQQKLSANLSLEDIIKAMSMLSDEDFSRMLRMLVLKHEALHMKRNGK